MTALAAAAERDDDGLQAGGLFRQRRPFGIVCYVQGVEGIGTMWFKHSVVSLNVFLTPPTEAESAPFFGQRRWCSVRRPGQSCGEVYRHASRLAMRNQCNS